MVGAAGAENVSLVGTQVTLVAVPLVAVQPLDASSTTMGLLSAAGRFPIMIFGSGRWRGKGPAEFG